MRPFEPLVLAPVFVGFALLLSLLVVGAALAALKRFDTPLMLGGVGVAVESILVGLAVVPISLAARTVGLISTAAVAWLFVSLMAALGAYLALLPARSIVEIVGLFADPEGRLRYARRWRYPVVGATRVLGAFYFVWTTAYAFGPGGILR